MSWNYCVWYGTVYVGNIYWDLDSYLRTMEWDKELWTKRLKMDSLESRFSVHGFVSQLWRKSFFLQNCETKPGGWGQKMHYVEEDLIIWGRSYPHTSGTGLHMCVCLLTCSDWSLTVSFRGVHLNIYIIFCITSPQNAYKTWILGLDLALFIMTLVHPQ